MLQEISLLILIDLRYDEFLLSPHVMHSHYLKQLENPFHS